MRRPDSSPRSRPPPAAWAYSYDGALQTAEAFSGFVTGDVAWDYDSFFRVQTERVRGGDQAIFFYDADGLLTRAGSLTYTRDAGGRLESRTETVGGVTGVDSYTYDLAGRLATVSRDGNAVASYTYDPSTALGVALSLSRATPTATAPA